MNITNKTAELITLFSDQLPYYTQKDNRRKSINCAIICVDEILKSIPMYTGNLNPTWKKWNEVKELLNKELHETNKN